MGLADGSSEPGLATEAENIYFCICRLHFNRVFAKSKFRAHGSIKPERERREKSELREFKKIFRVIRAFSRYSR